jgi:hypothetical protein
MGRTQERRPIGHHRSAALQKRRSLIGFDHPACDVGERALGDLEPDPGVCAPAAERSPKAMRQRLPAVRSLSIAVLPFANIGGDLELFPARPVRAP